MASRPSRTPSTEEIELREELEKAIRGIHSMLGRCPPVDENITPAGLDQATAVVSETLRAAGDAERLICELRNLDSVSDLHPRVSPANTRSIRDKVPFTWENGG